MVATMGSGSTMLAGRRGGQIGRGDDEQDEPLPLAVGSLAILPIRVVVAGRPMPLSSLRPSRRPPCQTHTAPPPQFPPISPNAAALPSVAAATLAPARRRRRWPSLGEE